MSALLPERVMVPEATAPVSPVMVTTEAASRSTFAFSVTVIEFEAADNGVLC